MQVRPKILNQKRLQNLKGSARRKAYNRYRNRVRK